ncbi:MAG: hypothetical protein GXO49_00680 [Chlorobi bacterium]|nr:hypothetical protein [Chlorobiota bacterium]
MKRLLTLIIILLFSFYSFSQDEEIKNDDNFGLNKKHFVHSFLNFGFMTPPKDGDGADINYGKSNSFSYGIKYRYKISETVYFGLSLYYNHQSWNIKQDEGKLIPVSTLYDSEKIILNNLGNDVFIRIKVKKKEYGFGNYIDIAPYGEWAFRTFREAKTESANNTVLGEDYNVLKNVNPNYIETLQYGIKLKFCMGRFGIVGKYRLSDLFSEDFKQQVSSTEFPRLNIGVELGLYQ